MNENIMVSICCPVYNHEKYLRKCLDGFINQKTNFKFEVLIHDDASTDNSATIIREYEKRYPDIIKPIYQKENQYSKGVKISFIYQYPRAKGKYIALCEGDDYWCDDNKLQTQVEYLETHDNCSMCFHSTKMINCKTDEECIQSAYKKNCIAPTSDIIIGGGMFVPTASIVFRKKYICEIPDYFYKADVGDYPLQIHLASKGDVYFFSKAMSVYRYDREGSWTERHLNQSIEEKKKHWRVECEWLEDFNKETSYQYTKAVANQILVYQYLFYDHGEKNKKELYEYARRVSKWQYIKTVIRTFLFDIWRSLKF